MAISTILAPLLFALSSSAAFISLEDIAMSQLPSMMDFIPSPEPVPETDTDIFFDAWNSSAAFWIIGRTVVDPFTTTLVEVSREHANIDIAATHATIATALL